MPRSDVDTAKADHGSVAGRHLSARGRDTPATTSNGSTSNGSTSNGSTSNGSTSIDQHLQSNNQTSARTTHEALYRYFSSPEKPAPVFSNQTAAASIAAGRARAQAVIEALDTTMEDGNGA